MCMKKFDNHIDDLQKVIHHDHFTGKYIATVCKSCNSKMKDKHILPVFFHNLRNFDGHLFVLQLAKDKDFILKVIPQSMEKYIAFSVTYRIELDEQIPVRNQLTGQFQLIRIDSNGQPVYKMQNVYKKIQIIFVDSFQHLSSSLADLIINFKLQSKGVYKSLPELASTFKITFNQFNNIPIDNLLSLISKGIYPYNYLKSYSDFNLNGLPPIEEFKSDLTVRKKSNSYLIDQINEYFNWNVLYIWSFIFSRHKEYRSLFPETSCVNLLH